MASSVSFPEPQDVGPRQWGREILLHLVSQKFSFKRIDMIKGAKGGLQYHHLKDEVGYMLTGRIRIWYDDGYGHLIYRDAYAGDVFHFPPGAEHQAEALTDCSYIEVSTPHFNDRVHVEDKYGIEHEDGGLPSTSLEEVELR
jgi:mannose-6-phosphate isomerase-like protein (cupin superfamily)